MNELQRTNETHFFIKIYLSHFILEKGTQFVVNLRDRWTDIYWERGHHLAPYLLPGASECQRLHPLGSRTVRDASDQMRIPGLILFWLDTKSDLVVFISRGPLPVTYLLNRSTSTHCHFLFTNHNVTACQSTWSHQERTQNAYQQSLYNTSTIYHIFQCSKTGKIYTPPTNICTYIYIYVYLLVCVCVCVCVFVLLFLLFLLECMFMFISIDIYINISVYINRNIFLFRR